MTGRIAFVGAGAVGSFVGGMLAKSGEDVALIDGWPEHIKAIKDDGLLVTGTHGRMTIALTAMHIHEVQSLAKSPLDVVFIATKAYDSEWAAALIKDYLRPGASVVSLQNGFNEERISRTLGGAPVVGCIASTLGAEIVEAGHVTRTYGRGGEEYTVFRLGETDGRLSDRLAWLVKLLSKVDAAKPTANLLGERWSKLVANAMINPLAGITGMRDREMMASSDIRKLAAGMGIEGVKVGHVLGYALVPVLGIAIEEWMGAGVDGDFGNLDRALVGAFGRATQQGRASTPVDIALGRRTELDYFNGLLISKSRELGLAVPFNEAVMDVEKEVEAGHLKPGVNNIDRLRFLLT